MPSLRTEANSLICSTNKELEIDTDYLDSLFQKKPEENSVIQSLRQDLKSTDNQELTFLPVSTLRFIAQEFGIYFVEQLDGLFMSTETKQSSHNLSDHTQTLLFSFNEMSGEMSLLTPK